MDSFKQTDDAGRDLLAIALDDVGTWEWAGAEHNPKVLAYYDDAGFPEIGNDEVPWCAAALNAWAARVGLPTTGSLLAQSFLRGWGRPVSWSEAREGDVMIWKRGSKSWQGHVNILVRKEGVATAHCIGGNQGDQVNVKPYQVGDSLLGIRRPVRERKSVAQSTTIQATGAGAVATATGATAAVGALDGTAQLVAIVCAMVIFLAFLWIARERVKKWAAGIR